MFKGRMCGLVVLLHCSSPWRPWARTHWSLRVRSEVRHRVTVCAGPLCHWMRSICISQAYKTWPFGSTMRRPARWWRLYGSRL